MLEEVCLNAHNRQNVYGIMENTEIPQIVVLGNKLSGKTTLLKLIQSNQNKINGFGLDYQFLNFDSIFNIKIIKVV